MQVPNISDNRTTKFCKSISDEPPILVAINPDKNSELNDCFHTVQKKVQEYGGGEVLGWAIWIWPKVMIEAEFHAVWKNPEGKLIDITPKAIPFESIVFLPDPRSIYKGRQVNNIRRPITKGLTIKSYIETANEVFKETNKGDLADFHGHFEPSPRLMKLFMRMQSLQSKLEAKYGKATNA